MSDLFHEGIPDEFVVRAFEVMAAADWHVFQVLTKRPRRMEKLADQLPWPPAHLGENERGTGQVHLAGESLPATGAGGVRFVSAEPLLGPPPSLELGQLDWVISGGESGPRCRPCEPGWVRDLRDRCVPAGVAFFHKQWGGRTPKAGGRLLDGRTW